MINFNELVSKYNKKGIPTPTIDMIKSKEEIEGIRKAGIINTQILDEVSNIIKPGISTEEINQYVHNRTIELGGIPAPLGYNGFPKSCCTSINDQVCHGIPSPSDILNDGDIVNVDCTTILNGFYADASRMFIVGTPSNEALRLVQTTKEALDLTIKNLKPYSRLGDIGYTIESYVKSKGYSVVYEIGGHGVGKEFHEDPFVKHYGKKNTGMVLFPGMVFTIEPMVNEFKRQVFLDADNEWTVYTMDGGLSAQFEYTVLITEEGIEILAK